MPTTYTHHRFGADCLGSLPRELSGPARRFRTLYDTGVHGPDIFFYCDPLRAPRVPGYGSALHRLTGREIFARFRPVFKRCGDRDRMLAYLLGFLTHFVLDSGCHGYIEEARRALGVSHNRLEGVYDSHLMLADGLVPSRVFRGAALCPSKENAELISRFFEPSEAEVLSSLRGQVRIMKLLYSPGGRKKRALRSVIRLLHLPGGLDGLFIDDEIPPELDGAMAKLDELYAASLAEYAPLAAELADFLDGSGGLSERFGRDFG